jgi:hypothetical protein
MNDIDKWYDMIDTHLEYWSKCVLYDIKHKDNEVKLFILFADDSCEENRVFMFDNNIFYGLYRDDLKIDKAFAELLQDTFTIDSVNDLYNIEYNTQETKGDWTIKNILETHITPEMIEHHNHFNGFDG